jgi:hypothetical protein
MQIPGAKAQKTRMETMIPVTNKIFSFSIFPPFFPLMLTNYFIPLFRPLLNKRFLPWDWRRSPPSPDEPLSG